MSLLAQMDKYDYVVTKIVYFVQSNPVIFKYFKNKLVFK